jgi:hypothetical protein
MPEAGPRGESGVALIGFGAPMQAKMAIFSIPAYFVH